MSAFRLLFLFLVWVAVSVQAVAVPMIDQSHVTTQSVGGLVLYSNTIRAQTFTTGKAGLLSQIDLQIGRDTGDIGNLTLDLLPVSGGVPMQTTPLFSIPIDTQALPFGGPSASLAYTPIDVSSGGLTVSPGEQYAIALRSDATLNGPNSVWNWGFPGYDGGDPFGSAFGRPYEATSSDFDMGFRTWIDQDSLGLSSLQLTPTSEWEASLSTTGASVVFTAGDSMRVRRFPTNDDDDRALIEFDASALPAGATIASASLDFQTNGRSQTATSFPIVDVYGYEADGFPSGSDARDLSLRLGGSTPITDSEPVSISLDPQGLSQMIQASSGIGLTAYSPVTTGVYVDIVSSQLADRFPTFYSPPTLTINYSVPTSPDLPAGDFNGDAHVDAADYTVWRDALGSDGTSPADGNGDGEVDDLDRAVWAAGYGTRPDAQVRNGGFETGDLSEWSMVVEPNTDVSPGFPRVESFDTDGDGQTDEAMRIRLGQTVFDSSSRGTAGIEQEILLGEGDYVFSADIATQSLEAFGNTGPGDYELVFDGAIIDSVNLNGTSIPAGGVLRDQLEATVTGVQPGYHTLRLVVSRTATNSRQIYHFFDNVEFSPILASRAVPEPATSGLFSMAVVVGFGRRHRR